MKKKKVCRRTFLLTSLCCAAPTVIPSTVLGFEGVSPNNKLNAMMIGLGSRGSELLGGFARDPEYKILGVCDCYRAHAERAQKSINQIYKNNDCQIIPQYEEVLQKKDLDLVIIATPDHWHAKISIEAIKSGKDVYCEKPLTLTLEEGRRIVNAARKYNRVCTGGSQRVMEDYGYMAPIIQSGAIGQVKEVLIGVGNPPEHCYLPEQPIPEGMDWDRWLGPTPWAPYNAERCSGSYGGGWRRFTEYGNGFLADWGAHKFAGAMYILGLDSTGPVEIRPQGYEGSPYASAVFKNGIIFRHAQDHDVHFIGTEGEYIHHKSKLKPLKTVEVRRYSGGTSNIRSDFAYCVRNRLRPFQDFEYASRAAAFCQLMAICYKLNRVLRWDPDKSEFINDPQAQRMVSRPQRWPYVLEDC